MPNFQTINARTNNSTNIRTRNFRLIGGFPGQTLQSGTNGLSFWGNPQSGPTGPTGPAGPAGGPQGPTGATGTTGTTGPIDIRSTYAQSHTGTCTIVATYTGGGGAGGSGWVCEVDPPYAYIATCAHVVLENAYSVPLSQAAAWQVVLEQANGILGVNVQVDCVLVGYDASADVALLRTKSLTESPSQGFDFTVAQTVIPWGSSDSQTPGSICMVIGNPASLDTASCAVGYVRDPKFLAAAPLQASEDMFISAPIIGGNSGSPVLDKDGQAIGMTSYVLVTDSVPQATFVGGSNQVMMEQIIKKIRDLGGNFNGAAGKGYLGINDYSLAVGYYLMTLRQAYPAFSSSSLDVPQGAAILALDTSGDAVPGSRLHNGVPPVQVGDIITSITTTVAPLVTLDIGPFSNQYSWQRETHFRAGETVILQVVRPSTASTFSSTVILDQYPSSKDVVFTSSSRVPLGLNSSHLESCVKVEYP